jgi:SSS family solute:Na+ symporter
VIGGAGALTAMVPAAIQILTAATLFAKNLCRPILAPAMTDQQVAKLARITVLVITSVALLFAIYNSATIVSLLLLGYAGITQFFPGVVFGLFSKRVSVNAVFAGIVVGIGTVTFLALTHRDPWMGLNAGFLALCLNFAIVVVVSSIWPPRSDEANPFPVAAA